MAKKITRKDLTKKAVKETIDSPIALDSDIMDAIKDIPTADQMVQGEALDIYADDNQVEEPQPVERTPQSTGSMDVLFQDPEDVVSDVFREDPNFREERKDRKIKDRNVPGADSTFGEATTRIKNAMEDMGYLKNLKDRAMVSLGTNDEERFKILQNRYGKGNVKMSGGNLYLRESSDQDFARLDPKGFDALDVADYAGDIIEMTLGIASEVGLFAATAGYGTAARIGARLTGVGSIGMVGSMARSGLADMAGAGEEGELPVEYKDLDRAYQMGLGNLAGYGIGSFLQKGFRYGKDIYQSTPRKVVEKAAQINTAAEDLVRTVGRPDSVEAAAKQISNSMSKAKNDFGRQVGLVKTTAKQAVGDRPVFQPTSYLRQAQEEFTDMGVFIDPTTSIAKITNDTLAPPDVGGMRFLKEAVGEYNDIITELRQKGGLSLDKIDNLSNSMGSKVSALYKGTTTIEKSPQSAAMLRRLMDEMVNDKNAGLVSAIQKVGNTGGKSAKEVVEGAMSEYVQASKAFDNFRKLYKRTKGDAEMFVDSLTRKGNLKQLKEVKQMIGPESEDWKMLQAVFFDNAIQKATSSSTGIMDINKLVDVMSDAKIGREVRNEFLSDGNYARLRKLAREFDKVDVSKIIGAPGSSAGELLFAMSPIASPFFKAKLMWSMFSKSSDLADEVYEKGFRQFAEEAKRRTGKTSKALEWLQAKKHYGNLLFNARKVGDKYESTPIVRTMLRQTLVDGSEETYTTIDDVEGVSKGMNQVGPMGSQEAPVNPL